MVIHDLDILCVAIMPAETDSPLVVDADAVLTLPAACQFLESIAWRDSQILDCVGRIKHRQFSKGRSLHISAEFP